MCLIQTADNLMDLNFKKKHVSFQLDSSSRDYSVDDSISKVEYFSNAVLEDTYDQACRSRVRDAELMKNANATIVSNAILSSLTIINNFWKKYCDHEHLVMELFQMLRGIIFILVPSLRKKTANHSDLVFFSS